MPNRRTSRLKAGIIGLDAHAQAWTKILNNPEATGELGEMVVVAGYPGGSPDIPQSMDLLKRNTEPVRKMGVEIVDSIEVLLKKVDVVMILSIDGRTHLEQARPVFAAGKRVYIDKPLAGSLADAIKIFRLAKKHNVPVFSSSSLRFAPGNAGRDPQTRKSCRSSAAAPSVPARSNRTIRTSSGTASTAWKPSSRSWALAASRFLERRSMTPTLPSVSGKAVAWARSAAREAENTPTAPRVFGSKKIVESGKFEGYEPLLVEIVKFFKTGKPPVAEATTLEILAFMEAADESKRQGGRSVTIESVMKKALREADAAKE